MNILIFNTLYYPYSVGGAERSVQLLAEGMVEKGNKVTVATLHELSEITEENVNGVRVVRFPLKNIYWIGDHSQSGVRKLRWHIKDIYNFDMLTMVKNRFFSDDFDIVHTNNLSGFSVAVWDWAKSKKITICHTTRDYHLLHPNGTLFKNSKNISTKSLDAKIFAKIKKIKSKKVDCFVAISKYVENIHKINGFFENANSVVIYNSIKSTNYQREFCTKNKITLGFLGRVEEEKGIEHFLTAVAHLDKNRYSLLIAGKGDKEYLDELSEKFSNLDANFLGPVDIEKFFPKIDYLVVPSLWHEPMGRVVIEANSFGVPVIGSNRGGIPEIIENKATGYIFDVDDSNSLMSVLNELASINLQTYMDMCKKAKEYSGNFSSDNVVLSYLEAYKLSKKK